MTINFIGSAVGFSNCESMALIQASSVLLKANIAQYTLSNPVIVSYSLSNSHTTGTDQNAQFEFNNLTSVNNFKPNNVLAFNQDGDTIGFIDLAQSIDVQTYSIETIILLFNLTVSNILVEITAVIDYSNHINLSKASKTHLSLLSSTVNKAVTYSDISDLSLGKKAYTKNIIQSYKNPNLIHRYSGALGRISSTGYVRYSNRVSTELLNNQVTSSTLLDHSTITKIGSSYYVVNNIQSSHKIETINLTPVTAGSTSSQEVITKTNLTEFEFESSDGTLSVDTIGSNCILCNRTPTNADSYQTILDSRTLISTGDGIIPLWSNDMDNSTEDDYTKDIRLTDIKSCKNTITGELHFYRVVNGNPVALDAEFSKLLSNLISVSVNGDIKYITSTSMIVVNSITNTMTWHAIQNTTGYDITSKLDSGYSNLRVTLVTPDLLFCRYMLGTKAIYRVFYIDNDFTYYDPASTDYGYTNSLKTFDVCRNYPLENLNKLFVDCNFNLNDYTLVPTSIDGHLLAYTITTNGTKFLIV